MKAQWLNGWTRETFLKQIEKMNGFEACVKDDFNFNCMYRNDNGKACLVGAFIPDDMYDIEMEGKSFDGYSRLFKNIDFPLDSDHMYLLQKIHDDSLFSTFEEKYKVNNLKDAIINFLDGKGLK